MSINPATNNNVGLAPVAADNLDDYLDEMFDQKPQVPSYSGPPLPSFKEFLFQSRGIDLDKFFSKPSKELMAMIMETTIYSQFIARISQMQSTQPDGPSPDENGNDPTEEEMLNAYVDNAPIEQVENTISSMKRQLELAEHRLKTRSTNVDED